MGDFPKGGGGGKRGGQPGADVLIIRPGAWSPERVQTGGGRPAGPLPSGGSGAKKPAGGDGGGAAEGQGQPES